MACYCLCMKDKNRIKFSRIYKRWDVLLLFSILLGLFVHFLSSSLFMQDVELKLTDYRFRLSPHQAQADTNVVIVAIDDGSLDYFRNNGVSYPWPRSFYRHVVEYLTASGAKAIMFDIQFYEPDLDREETSAAETDQEFADAVGSSKQVCLAAHLYDDLGKFSIIDIELNEKVEEKYRGIRVPIKQLLDATSSLGVITVEPDMDGTIRRIPMLYKYRDYYLPQMSLAALMMGKSEETIMQFNPRQFVYNSNRIPLDNKDNYFPNWYGKDAFKSYPFQAVINSASQVFYGKEPLIPLSAFKDKYVIIGATASGVNDLRSTPIDPILPGLEIWATILSNFLQEDYVQDTSGWIDLIILIIIIWFVMLTVVGFNTTRSNILLILMLIFITAINFFLWDFYRILVNYSEHFVGFVVSYLFIITTSYLSEGRARREIRQIFTRYLHPDVVRQLEENPEQVILGGKEINATVMYLTFGDEKSC